MKKKEIVPIESQVTCNECQSHKAYLIKMIEFPGQTNIFLLCDSCGLVSVLPIMGNALEDAPTQPIKKKELDWIG